MKKLPKNYRLEFWKKVWELRVSYPAIIQSSELIIQAYNIIFLKKYF